ncbi:hypothetical protein CLOHAE12215_01442 [Clostridium haemolyticum]|uniref:DUF4238 domain-containing protein n=1 Tax=Clostridium haemolyticum TaxID=84025 RepID=UPI001C395D97|nr:DUF4238 domain-containing protein [Clostridium haemolyticum]CAG7840026.1 hypothetical protein CLOHAE12215_01442 [Clostridium haemolyticum]
MSKKKTKRNHFISKVYLKQWIQPQRNYVYGYDLLTDKFLRSSHNVKQTELHLNDRKFWGEKIYNQHFEDELSGLESNYESWIKHIDLYYEHGNLFINNIDNIDTQIVTKNLEKVSVEIIVFLFIQWIRMPNTDNRHFLFNIFKDLFLKSDCEWQMLSANEYVILNCGTDQEHKIFSCYDDDKKRFEYVFNYIDEEKIKNITTNNYIVQIARNHRNNFFTSTHPIVPNIIQRNNEPRIIGVTMALSPRYIFRIIKKSEVGLVNIPKFVLPVDMKDENLEDKINLELISYNLNDNIIYGDNAYISQFLVKYNKSIQKTKIRAEQTISTIKNKNLDDTFIVYEDDYNFQEISRDAKCVKNVNDI